MNEWAQVIPNGTISNLGQAFAESGNELAKYLEYLYQEKKYNNARNLSSITHMTDLVAYKRNLPKSAIGYAIVAPTDKDGKNRLSNYGVEFFDLDASSDYDELTQNKNATSEEKASLVPWTANKSYCIPEGTVFTSSSGIKFIATESVESRSLKEPFSVIKKDDTKYKSFIEAGGWNGIKYIKVPVIQGEVVTTQLGQAQGTRYESFTLDSLDVENASNIISCKFFKVLVKPIKKVNGTDVDDGDTEIWEKIENVGLAGAYDKVFEIKILDDENKLLFKFGNGITGKMLPKDAIITVQYLKTLGASGNLSSKYQLNTLTLPNGEAMVDPRTNTVSNFLCCTNISPINGGYDIEGTNDIRQNAPEEYLDSYTISSKKSYLKQIESNSPVNLLHPHIFSSEVVESESYGNSDNDDADEYVSSVDTSILQETTQTKNSILVCALRSNGEEIEDPETELVEPLKLLLDDYMSTNDSLDFVKPNLIRLCPRIKIGTSSNILEKDIYDELRPKIYSKFSVFNRDFSQPLYESEIIDTAHNLSYAKKVDEFIEAKATVDMKPTILTKALQTGATWLDYTGSLVSSVKDIIQEDIDNETLFSFDFSFDDIFMQDKINCGFKNYKYNSPYLLKVDVIFNEEVENSRTLFLLDNRKNIEEDLSVEEAYYKSVDSSKRIPDIDNKGTYGDVSFDWFDELDNNFKNFQMRTAQFTKIDLITDENFMDQAKSFIASPFEIRPLFINDKGENEIFNKDDVPSDSRVSLNFNSDVKEETCYRKNFQYWEHTRILFTEDYKNSKACGKIIVPINRILTSEDIESLKNLFADVESFSEQEEDIKKLISDKVQINVYALPVQTTFKCNNENDLIFVEKEDILIEKNTVGK